MAHYDCSNCGATMGIDFGFCDSCTPKEYFDLKKQYNSETARLVQEYGTLTLKQLLKEAKKYKLEDQPIDSLVREIAHCVTEPTLSKMRDIETKHTKR